MSKKTWMEEWDAQVEALWAKLESLEEVVEADDFDVEEWISEVEEEGLDLVEFLERLRG